MTRALRDPLEPVRWRWPLAVSAGLLAVVLVLALGVPAVLRSRAEADRTAVAALVDGFAPPGGVDEPCTHGADRCWTTAATPDAVRTSGEAQMRAAGVTIVETSCLDAIHAGLADTCVVTGTLKGRTVSLSAFPLLAPDPPLRQVAIDVWLSAD